MINTIKTILGYSGTSEIVEAIIVAIGGIFIVCLCYAMIDFINNLITHILK